MAKSKKIKKVFICYSGHSIHVVQRLKHYLNTADVEVWVDYANIRPGDNMPKQIDEALECCDAVILVWSYAASKSEWVQEEWTSAITLKKLIIPCLMDQAKLPNLLANRTYLDFRNIDRGITQLVNFILTREK